MHSLCDLSTQGENNFIKKGLGGHPTKIKYVLGISAWIGGGEEGGGGPFAFFPNIWLEDSNLVVGSAL